jgi:hypothetical protein
MIKSAEKRPIQATIILLAMIASLVLGTQSCLITARAETATTAPEIKVEPPSMLKSLLGKTEPPAKTGPVELKRYLPEQPNLKGFANGDSLDPYSELHWDKIYDQATGGEASYTVVIINPERREAIAWKHVVGNSCKVKDIKNINDLIDNKEYKLQVVAYLDKADVASREKRKTYNFVYDKYPGVKSTNVIYQGKLIAPVTDHGLQTSDGIMLKWEPNIKNHTWVIRMVKVQANGRSTVGLFKREELAVSEFLLEDRLFSTEDEDARIKISINSDQSLSTPIEVEFRINNNNLSPYPPAIRKEDGRIVVWEGLGDPDEDEVAYKLAIETFSETTSEPIPVREVMIGPSGRLDLVEALEREKNYRCFVIAQDPAGLITRSEPVFIRLNIPPIKPIVKGKTNKKNLSKANRIIITHENYNNNQKYKYYVRYQLEKGGVHPAGKAWLTENPMQMDKNRVELAIRSTGKQIEIIEIVVRASNNIGETADTTVTIMGKGRKKR